MSVSASEEECKSEDEYKSEGEYGSSDEYECISEEDPPMSAVESWSLSKPWLQEKIYPGSVYSNVEYILKFFGTTTVGGYVNLCVS